MRIKAIILSVFAALLLVSCGEDPLPKPKAMLRLDYKAAKDSIYETTSYLFSKNTLAVVQKEQQGSLVLDYPEMKGSVFLTYKPVESNLDKLLTDAQKLSYEHVVKADNILEQPFVNSEDKVFGMFYEVQGNAASQAQFYVTDSVNHFVTGAAYFYAKPNYDSILPAAHYLQQDIRRIMETIRWK